MSATETDKTPIQVDGTAEKELYPDESRSLEDLRHMRLMALLRDMMESRRRSWCQGAVQKTELVPKTEVGLIQS